MSVRAWPISLLTLRGLDCGFYCCRLCRSAPNIPVRHTYRRALSTLLPSVSPPGPPLDLSPNKTNICGASVDPSADASSASAMPPSIEQRLFFREIL